MGIKVLHIIDHLGLGGGQMSLRTLVENSNSEQAQFLICALRPKSETIPIDAEIITLNYNKFSPRTFFAVAKLCKEYKIDILHAHLSKSIITCLSAGFICKVPVIIHERGGIWRKGISFCLYRFLLRFLNRRAAAVIANSKATALELQTKAGIDKTRIEVIYNPLDFTVFEPDNFSREKSREKLNIADEDFVIGYVGRLHPVKGVDILIRAFASFLKKSPQSLLVLTGDGPDRMLLEQLSETLKISDSVRFLGMRNDIPAVMAAFDIGMAPSRQEPFGRVAIELMRMRVPVICSGVDGLSEIVTDGDTGIITKQNTPEEIVRCIERLQNNKEMREKIIKNAFEFSQQFSAAEHVKKITQIYEQIQSSS